MASTTIPVQMVAPRPRRFVWDFVIVSIDSGIAHLTSLGTRALGNVHGSYPATENGYAGLGSAQGLNTFLGHLSFLEVDVLEALPIGEFGRSLIADPFAGF